MLEQSIKTSLINKEINSNLQMQHKLLINQNGDKIFTHIINYFRECDEFKIIVAFITKSGVSILKTLLLELEKNGIKGQILTGDYQNFTDPEALEWLNKFENIDIRMLENEKLHIKGYFFQNNNNWNMVIGSSNLTAAALTDNQEMNIKITSTSNGLIVERILETFDYLWQKSRKYDDFIQDYKMIYAIEKEKKQEYKKIVTEIEKKHKIEKEVNPNKMQIEALNRLHNYRKNNQNKSLIIAATGTGKTFLAAFDVKAYKANKVLFVVHREKIAKSALKTFKTIIKDKTYGLYTGNRKEEAEYLFTTIQSLHNNLEQFDKDQFDYIIIDEVHHGGGKTYQKVVSYFKPKFLLGLTATPERGDNFNIFEMFDNNIAYEIRLNKAYEYNLLAPFHYFGVEEVQVNGSLIKDNENFNNLISDERIKHIIQKVNYYGHSAEDVVGLIFVSSIKEAIEMSDKLNDKGLRTKALTSNDSEKDRELAINKLENKELNYLITVDIFNEGIDIPSVNQIIMLRPTESAIIYTQQLGRGLRKFENKKYVVIIDFIGNYKNDFMIPIALSGDNTFDKDALKSFLINGTNKIVGQTVINFEEVPYKQIIDKVNSVNFSNKIHFKKDYKFLKNKLNQIPKLSDFEENNLMIAKVILNIKGFNTYLDAVNFMESNQIKITKDEYNILKFVSQELLNLKRLHEILIIDILLNNGPKTLNDLEIAVNEYLNETDEVTFNNSLKHLTKQIFTNSYMDYDSILKIDNQLYKLNTETISKEFKENINELIKLIKAEAKRKNNYLPSNELMVFEKYNKKEIFHILNEDYIPGGINLQGCRFLEAKKKVLIYITIEDTEIFKSYENEFISPNELIWYSQERKKFYKNGKKTKELLIAENYYQILMFVRKTKGEPFYYLGVVKETLKTEETVKNNNSIIKYKFKLSTMIRKELFNYFKDKRNKKYKDTI